jgi:hypothetical protein
MAEFSRPAVFDYKPKPARGGNGLWGSPARGSPVLNSAGATSFGASA